MARTNTQAALRRRPAHDAMSQASTNAAAATTASCTPTLGRARTAVAATTATAPRRRIAAAARPGTAVSTTSGVRNGAEQREALRLLGGHVDVSHGLPSHTPAACARDERIDHVDLFGDAGFGVRYSQDAALEPVGVGIAIPVE